MKPRSRLPVVIVILAALLATGFTRQIAASKRDVSRKLGGQAAASGQQLSRMNSFALALLLGGLRGPLVMMLWTSSEAQKTEKNLEDFDTKVEWIRLLQPEFDSVHIFQIWNKAYNISVQMASLANKYLTIIDAIDYAKKVDRERPDNINIVYAIGSVFGDKLGDSAEKLYYRKRVRDESLPHPSRQKLKESDPGYRRLELDSVLDDKGNILPEYLQSTGVHLADPDVPTDVYDGSELPFLKQFEPFPDGISPFGFAYNYRKRAQLLQRLANQKHSQLSEIVIDSRPAIDLNKWGEAEWDRGRRNEIQAFNRPIPEEKMDMEPVTADMPPNYDPAEVERKHLEQALAAYAMAVKLWEAADVEYVQHLQRFKTNFDLYQSHRDELKAHRALVQADHDYVAAILATTPEQKAALLKSAEERYRRAIVDYSLQILHYYIPDDFAAATFPPGATRQNFAQTLGAQADTLTPQQIVPIVMASLDLYSQAGYGQPEEATEYLTYMRRCEARLRQISRLTGTG